MTYTFGTPEGSVGPDGYSLDYYESARTCRDAERPYLGLLFKRGPLS